MGQGASSLIFLALLIGIFYFMLIRPQKRRVQQHQQLVKSIEEGDEVITIGGMVGTVAEMDDDHIVLEVFPGTRIRFIRSAISRKVVPEADYEDDDDDVEDEDEEEYAEATDDDA
ncbi:MAG: preprotein translocase subunit YajC [Actinomycetota bacterium]|nr:preprotein translocase subunit YajC [Actinomycetota bacterium]MEA2487840.1 preprotein translocase subunit YajC [Actinomycetota bacterium]